MGAQMLALVLQNTVDIVVVVVVVVVRDPRLIY